MSETMDDIDLLPTRLIDVEQLVPYARNSRKHSPAQVEVIARSIKEFGWTVPCLTDGANGLIAGHGRILAALSLGLKRVPCIDLSHLSEAQKRAYVIADNAIPMHTGATWDMELLRLEISELKLEGFDVTLLGFDDLTDLLDPDLLVAKDPDDVPDVPEVAFSVMGDQWVMGASTTVTCPHCKMQNDLQDARRKRRGML